MKPQKKRIVLSKKQSDQLWGVDGPYSEARLIFCSRILEDKISRVFVEVEIAVNPFTFKLISDHREDFADDEMIQQLLDHSDYRGPKHGYVSCAFTQEHTSTDDIEEASIHLQYAEQTLVRMHRFVMRYLDLSVN